MSISRVDKQTRSTNFGSLVLGALAGSILVACGEVFWTNAKPLLPARADDAQILLPPRHFWIFVLWALGTYAALGLVLSSLLLAAARIVRLGRSSLGAFFTGFFVTGAGFSVVIGTVWAALLSWDPPLSTASLVRYGQIVAGVSVSFAIVSWAAARLFRSLGTAVFVTGLVLPAGLLAGAWLAHRQVEYPPIAVAREQRQGLPNILFITIDTLRADFVGAYGSNGASTPVLDRLAAEGVRFETAISQVPTTTPSHVSMFTSTYPFVHGAKNGVPMRPGLATLPAQLEEIGYHTAAFISAYTTRSAMTGLGSAFDVYSDSLNPDFPFLSTDELEPLVVFRLLDRLAGNEILAPVVNARVQEWLKGVKQPFFVWVHYFDPHEPFIAPPEYAEPYTRPGDTPVERNIALYKGEITFTDTQLGLLLESFRSSGLLDDSIIVVTADHGEAFSESHPHVDSGHGKYLYDSVLRVPLIFWSPTRIPGGEVLHTQVESIDIAPTLLEILGLAASPNFAGRSLLPLIRGEPGGDAVAFSQTANMVRPRWFSVRSRVWKLIVDPDRGVEELYNLSSDPGEERNRAATEVAVAERFREQLARTMQLGEAGANLDQADAETVRRLRALGYLKEGE